MRIAIRVDASTRVGTGHMTRCLTLAEDLVRRGHDVHIVARGLPGAGLDRVPETVSVHRLPADLWPDVPVEESIPVDDQMKDALRVSEALEGDVDWVVLDNYGLAAPWETLMRESSVAIAVIDDLANRAHDCDLLLDQNQREDARRIYRPLVGGNTRMLLGPHHALLRAEFKEQQARGDLTRNAGLRRVLVFLGGGDEHDYTARILRGVAEAELPGVSVDVVIGPANRNAESVLREAARIESCSVSVGVSDMAHRMRLADLAIGAGGTATWERCVLGLPTLMVITAANQVDVVRQVEAVGAGWSLGADPSPSDVAAALRRLAGAPDELARASARAVEICPRADGAAVFAEKLESSWIVGVPGLRLRALRPDDGERLFGWRNSERVRERMADPRPLEPGCHAAWFARQLEMPDVRHLIAEVRNRPVGLASLTSIDATAGSAEWGFYVGEAPTPAGTGSRMCFMLLDIAFGILGLELVASRVRHDNVVSLRIHERFGFRVVKDAGDEGLVEMRLSATAWDESRDIHEVALFGSHAVRHAAVSEREP